MKLNFVYTEDNDNWFHFTAKNMRNLHSNDLFSTLLANLVLKNKPLAL